MKAAVHDDRPAGERLREYRLAAAEIGAVSAQTVLVALLPVLLARHGASTLWIGVVVGGEGVFALAVPFLSGAASDRVPGPLARRFGRRMVVVVPGAAVLAAAVAVTPFLPGFWWIALVTFVSFAALHAVMTPFWALLLDDVPRERRASVQGIRGTYRAVGLAYGLVGAGLVFSAWHPLPFLVAGALVVACTGITWAARRDDRGGQRRGALRESWRAIAANRTALWLLAADALWNASVDGIRPYFFLYAKETLGMGVSQTSTGLAVLVAVLGAGSWWSGRLGDRHDRHRMLAIASLVLAAAFSAGFFARHPLAVIGLATVAGAASAVIMTLPLPLFSSIVGEEATGESTGIYEMSVTVGRVASPLLVGGAIDLAAGWGVDGRGYPAMWLVASALAAAGGWCVHRSRRAARRGVAAELRRAVPARAPS